MPEAVTNARLIEVAIDMFGRSGLDAVTTRAIAEAAGAQQSAISYHFGTKERLYLACAEHIATFVGSKIGPLLADLDPGDDPAAAADRIERILGGLATIMMQDDVAAIARFVVREQMTPSAAFGILYERTIRRLIEALTADLAIVARGGLSDEALRVRCVALVGQVFAFRFARAALLRVTGWESVGAREADIVRETVIAHTRAVLAELASDSS